MPAPASESSRLARLLARWPWKSSVIGTLIVFVLGYLLGAWLSAGGDTPQKPPSEKQDHSQHAGHGPAAGGSAGAMSMSMRRITLTPEAVALMNIETARVQRRYVTNVVRLVGKVDYDETRLKYITAWVPGRLDRLFVDFTGVEVAKGDHLVLIYSEELYSAQQELIQAVRSAKQLGGGTLGGVGANLVRAAREKLRLLGLTEEQIRQIEQRGEPVTHLTIYSPIGGTVIEKLRQEGDRVRLGDRIYTVADLSQVWIKLDAYESDLVWLRYGQEVRFTTEAYPGEVFRGRIAFIDPVLDQRTRTAKVRVNVPNQHGKLKPEMFVHGEIRALIATGGRVLDPELSGKWICKMHPEVIEPKPGKCRICGMTLVSTEELGYVAPTASETDKPLVIPVSAPLVTGTRAIVYVKVADAPGPTFEGREVVLGPRAGNYYLVRHGLKEGELVVTRGNFTLDSEVQIQAKPSMMTPEGGGGGGHDHGGHSGGKKPAGGQAALFVSEEFRREAQGLLETYEVVREAIRSGNMERIRAAFWLFGATLEDVHSELLQGHALMLWLDLRMMLRNDVVLGREVQQLHEARRIFKQLTEHIDRLRRQLLAVPQPKQKPGQDDHSAHKDHGSSQSAPAKHEHEH